MPILVTCYTGASSALKWNSATILGGSGITANWTGDAQIGSETTSCSPSCVAFSTYAYVFYADGSSNLKYAKYDGTSWTTGSPSTSISIVGSPAAIAKGSSIYIFYQGSQNTLKYVTFNGTSTWSSSVSSPTATIYGSPTVTLTPDSNRIAIFYPGSTTSPGNNLVYTTFSVDGIATPISADDLWSAEILVPSTVGITASPSASTFSSRMHLFYVISASGSPGYSISNGEYWSPTFPLLSTPITNSPATTVFGSTIAYFHMGGSSNTQLWYNQYNGVNWVGDIQVPSTTISTGSPSVCAFTPAAYEECEDKNSKSEVKTSK